MGILDHLFGRRKAALVEQEQETPSSLQLSGWWPHMATLAIGLGLIACGPARHSPPRAYAQSTDSATASCLRNPVPCKPQLGEQFPVVPTGPGVRPPPPSPTPLSGAPNAALNIAAAVRVVSVAIEASLQARIQQALFECADEARSHVMLKHFGERGPTPEECRQVVGVDSNGEPVTRAMQLGVEQHQVALQCAQEKLQELKPDGFSISPRYVIEPGTAKAQYLSPAQVKALLNAGRSSELRGSLEPDIVIHTGSPLQVQLVFDFKFPCVNGGQTPWRRYPKGHPYEGQSQQDLYRKLLSDKVFRVLPRFGILK